MFSAGFSWESTARRSALDTSSDAHHISQIHPISTLSTILGLCEPLAALLLDFAHRVDDKPRNNLVLSTRYFLRETTPEWLPPAENVALDLLSQNYVAKIMGRHWRLQEGPVLGDDDAELMS